MEEKIKELEERIEVLEKIERKRRISKRIKLIFNLIITLAVIAALIIGYVYFKKNYIDPMQEGLNKIDNIKTELTEKLDDTIDSIDISKLKELFN